MGFGVLFSVDLTDSGYDRPEETQQQFEHGAPLCSLVHHV